MLTLMPEIRDPIHGFILFDALERALLNSRAMQRLKYVHQLALTYLVYPSATHSRFEHALGTMELAGRAFDAIQRNSPDVALQVFGDEAEQRRWRATARIGGLLHDIGHAPFSHAGDTLLGNRSHESIGESVILDQEISDILSGAGTYRIDPKEVAFVATGRGEAPNEAALMAKEIIAGDLGVDRMDYLRRDSYMCGVAYGMFDLHRLVGTLRLARRGEDRSPALALELGGVQAAEGLLTARYFMFSQVYFHQVRVAYDEHLIRFLRAFLPNGEYPEGLEDYLTYDDIKIMTLVRQHAEHDIDAKAITDRQHFRVAYRRDSDPLSDYEFEEALKDRLSSFDDSVIISSGSKNAVAISRGDVLVFDPLDESVSDILDRSQMLSELEGVGYIRAFAQADVFDAVKDEVGEFVAQYEEGR
ncbi:MAG: HD domain-containing protein [Chloroflexi bacterium]|nr:HD domain-containing protein [Chloroflexota bacterium]